MTDSSPETAILTEDLASASPQSIESVTEEASAPETEEKPKLPADPCLELNAVLRESVSSALWENSVPVLLELSLRNLSDREFRDLEITLDCQPSVLRPTCWRVQSLEAGQFQTIDRLDVELDGAFLASLSEAARAEVRLRVSEIQPDGSREELLDRVFPLTVRCRSEWGGLQGLPDLLAAFVLPNDPAVAKILRSASALLQDAGQSPSLEGYQGGRKRAWEQAQAIWCAIAALKITYVSPPASFVEDGQRVRLPTQIVEERLATCLDTALLFAGCLEAIGLRPLLIMLKGHAFTGFWLSREQSGTSVLQDLPSLRNRVALDDVCVFETTLVTAASSPAFSKACERGLAQLQDGEEPSKFEDVIDIHRARLRRIRPLSQVVVAAETPEADQVEGNVAPLLQAAPALREELGDHDEEDTPQSRLERWCKRLLDISGRSRLLNLPRSEKQIIEICCADPGKLEDRLAEMRGGERKPALRLRARPELMDGAPPSCSAAFALRYISVKAS
ncbi:disulfide oxidoreductase, partial [Gluconobacter japonicus]